MSNLPLCATTAAAGVCSAIFLFAGVLCILNGKQTDFKLYIIMGVSSLLRGTGYAVCAGTILRGSSNVGEAVIYSFFLNAGFGMCVAVASLLLGVWFKNASMKSKPPQPHHWRMLCILFFPVAIISGPVLGIVQVVEIYGVGGLNQFSTAKMLRMASVTALLADTSVSALIEISMFLMQLTSVRRERWATNSDKMVGIMAIASLLLLWSAAFRVRSTYVDPSLMVNERLYYPLQVLPELLQIMLWAVPGLMHRAGLGNGYEAWYELTHGVPPAGGSHSQDAVTTDSDMEAGKGDVKIVAISK
ncbi:hypothetical protein CEUSTIGMA_g6985.t1 [Chlamydomonas eustigma]|uniref:THH1/TOM1/TOM3 domain-containing protein n=1 Tax=Chlamydomonas eustigma TaxID=1157962 RepID=A0A250X8Z3_9CHLO|nr:hypothetical protein CEUSTIGMA_g6985.t1 [Chlamydomonas eustigma]|eukprot:GAX79544.1 hypothetical protein CEUSTIGMA_g6985.t1 [Chlamydomonas eustigma]